MLQDVPKATLVVTNPTHLAVAMRYDRGVDAAPVVVAKGADQFAFQIVAKARRHGIPVVERKPVAQALYKTVKVVAGDSPESVHRPSAKFCLHLSSARQFRQTMNKGRFQWPVRLPRSD